MNFIYRIFAIPFTDTQKLCLAYTKDTLNRIHCYIYILYIHCISYPTHYKPPHPHPTLNYYNTIDRVNTTSVLYR